MGMKAGDKIFIEWNGKEIPVTITKIVGGVVHVI
jgi:hypothetical protein